MADSEAWANIIAHIQALPESVPRTKSGKIRQLLPYIEASVHAGITLKRLCEELSAQGLHMTYAEFKVLLSRARRKAKKPVKPTAHTQVEKETPRAQPADRPPVSFLDRFQDQLQRDQAYVPTQVLDPEKFK
jgi:hypothetical protein